MAFARTSRFRRNNAKVRPIATLSSQTRACFAPVPGTGHVRTGQGTARAEIPRRSRAGVPILVTQCHKDRCVRDNSGTTPARGVAVDQEAGYDPRCQIRPGLGGCGRPTGEDRLLRLSVRLAVCLAVLLGMLAGAGTALAAGGVVISEFRTRGPLGGNDEFVEIYNASNAPVDVTGWTIRGSNNAAGTSARATVTSPRLLDAGCYLLF